MTLIDAVKTERHFRRTGEKEYCWEARDGMIYTYNVVGEVVPAVFSAEDILATDYEVKEPKVEITRSQLEVAIRKAHSEVSDGAYRISTFIDNVASNLGLGDDP